MLNKVTIWVIEHHVSLTQNGSPVSLVCYVSSVSSGPQRGGQGGQIAPGPRTPRGLRL